MLKVRFTKTLAMAAIAGLLITGCSSSSEPTSDGSGIEARGTLDAPLLRVATNYELTSWDPAMGNEAQGLPFYQAVYDSLIRRMPDGSLEPMIATEWEVSDDLLSMTLTLRDDVQFADGTPLDSEAVKKSLDHFRTAGGPLGSNLVQVDNVETPSEYEVVINLKEPDPMLAFWLGGLAGMIVNPEHVGSDTLDTIPAGSGPYVMNDTSSVVGSVTVYDRRDDYWNEPEPFEVLEYHYILDETARVNALRSGQVDAGYFVRGASGIELDQAGLEHDEYGNEWEGMFIFDRSGELVPELADPRVREALIISLDREAMLDKIYKGAGELTSQIYGPESLGFVEELDDAYQYDPERAKELLAEADAEGLELTIPVTTIFDPAVYQSIQHDWEEVGFDITLHQWGQGEALPQMRRGDWPLAYFSPTRQIDWGQIPFVVGPDAAWNPLKDEDPELNELIKQLQYAEDETETQEASQAINTFLVENFWFAPLYRLDRYFYWNPEITDVEMQVGNNVPFIYNFEPAS